MNFAFKMRVFAGGSWGMDGTERVFDMELFAFTRMH